MKKVEQGTLSAKFNFNFIKFVLDQVIQHQAVKYNRQVSMPTRHN